MYAKYISVFRSIEAPVINYIERSMIPSCILNSGYSMDERIDDTYKPYQGIVLSNR